MTDFSCHKPSNHTWIDIYRKKLGEKQVLKDYEAIYDWLLKKPVGWKYSLSHAKGMQDKDIRDYRIKLICMFIADNQYDFYFNKTFTELKRVKINVKQKKLDTEGDAMAD